jgi:hypothetical protein
MPATTVETSQRPDAARPRPDPSERLDWRMPADEWRQLIRALAETDDEELPLFGRFPA